VDRPDQGSPTAELRVDWQEYYRLIERLALQIHASGYDFDALVCLARGGLRAGDVISRIFKRPLAVLTVSSYREAAGRERGELRIAAAISSIEPELRGRLLLVDDLADSGETLDGAVQYLKERFAGISQLRTAVIWVKGCSRFRPDYFAAFLPDSPWIHQPFEVYDDLGPDQLAQRLGNSNRDPG
jgi:hypoxanthine phosphoribosyltransferase